MELTNSFVVAASIDEAWDVLTDVERIAPCLPGAQLQEIEGDDYRGIVKVKVGPITAQYRGVARFVERDATTRRAVIKADGRDTRGQGNASALITAEMASDGPGRTTVTITTDLTVTGKVAQFGRGVMADVSAKLMGQFADNLSTMVLGGPSAPAAPKPASTPPSAGRPQVSTAAGPGAVAAPSTSTVTATAAPPAATVTTTAAPRREVITSVRPAASGAVRKLDLPDPEPIDLLDTAGTPVLKRAAPYALVAAVVAILMRVLGGSRR